MQLELTAAAMIAIGRDRIRIWRTMAQEESISFGSEEKIRDRRRSVKDFESGVKRMLEVVHWMARDERPWGRSLYAVAVAVYL